MDLVKALLHTQIVVTIHHKKKDSETAKGQDLIGYVLPHMMDYWTYHAKCKEGIQEGIDIEIVMETD